MSRVIKFRCWDKTAGRWLDRNPPYAHWIELPDKHRTFSLRDNGGQYEWMQFTGLLDRNGIEIYEGDIVKAYYPTTSKRITDEVSYDTEQFIGYKIGGTRMSACTDFKVIGNIYENPELLK